MENARRFGGVVRSSWMLGLAAGAAAIAWASRVYFSSDELAPFVIEKLPLPHQELWLAALKVHVVAASLALPACLLLSLRRMLRFPRVHRWLGRATGAVILVALVPSGLYLSLFAKGGAAATVGFALSGLIVALAMAWGVGRARARDHAGHRRCMLHVLAQLSVAVTSRTLLPLLDAAGVDPDPAYLFALWAPVLAGVGFVEVCLVRRPHRRSSHATQALADRPAPRRAPVADRPPGFGNAA
jgi:peptidoglycan/LPS O-acetylase OafA/YrhL